MKTKSARHSGVILLVALTFIASTSFALTKPDYPVIFVHGIIGTADATWGGFGSFLSGEGWQFGGSPHYDSSLGQVTSISVGDFYTMNMSDYNAPFRSQNLTLSEQGGELSAVIARVLSANPGKTKVILVGHSMGGLAARSYLQGLAKHKGALVPYRSDVAKVITVDTPHQGGELATVCQQFRPFGIGVCDLLGIDANSVGAAELRSDSPALLALNKLSSNPLPGDITYVSVIGTGLKLLLFSDQTGDGIVSTYSQNLGNVAGGNLLNHTPKEVYVQPRTDCDPIKKLDPLHGDYISHMCATADPGVAAELIRQFRPSNVSVAPTITFVSPRTLIASPDTQTTNITVTGTGFTRNSKLRFTRLDDNFAYPDRTPDSWTSTTLQYAISVGLMQREWSVNVVEGNTVSAPYTFYVVSGGVQLTALSISGPATVAENGGATFTAKAYFSDGTSPNVNATWSVTGTSANINSSSGQLTAGTLNANSTVKVNASYSLGGITRTASTDVTIVNSGSDDGETQTQELIVNGDFADAGSNWTLTGAFQAGPDFPTCRSCPGYAYVATASGEAGNNLSGTCSQSFTIPANASEVTFEYWHRTTTTEAGGNVDRLNAYLRLANNSLVGLDEIWNSNANAAYARRSIDRIDLTAYKGQRVTLEFLGTTDVSGPTTFRIDDVSVVATVPNPKTLVSIGVRGPSSVPEGTTGAYDAVGIYSDGSVSEITPTWRENSSATTISSSGVLRANSVDEDRSIIITATFDGFSLEYNVTIVNVAPEFSYLAISGPTAMNERSSSQFTAMAIFSDGSSESVSPSWSVASGPGDISNSGSLTVDDVSNDTTTSVSASHTIDGVTRNANQQVAVINLPPPVTLVSLNISGPSSLSENSTAQFSAIASFSDGSSQSVIPTWNEDSSIVSISSFGLLSAGEVASDLSVTFTASYTSEGITRDASKTVTVVNGTITPTYTVSVNASNGTVARSPDQVSYASGSQVMLTATPASGYQFSNWSGDATGGQNPLTLTINSDKSITANFTVPAQQRQLSEMRVNAGLFQFLLRGPVGNTYVVQVSTDLLTWVPLSTHTIPASGAINIVDSNGIGLLFYRATLSQPLYTVTPSAGANGNISPAVAQTVNSGGIIAFTATPLGEYAVDQWLVNGSVVQSGGNSYPLNNVTADMTVHVTFKRVSQLYTVSPSAGPNGSISPSTPQTVNSGGSVAFTATPARGHVVNQWLVDNSVAQNGNTTYTLSNVTANQTVEVTFSGVPKTGTVVAWGRSDFGQTAVPAGLSGVAAISAGIHHAVALKSDGTVVAWGLDDPESHQTSIPSGLTGVTAIAAGGRHTVALKSDGTVEAWGNNSEGNTTIPAGLGGVIAIAAGYSHTVALKSDGTVVAWGYNAQGQTTVPAGLSGVTAIAAGGYHTVVLKSDGTVVAWGLNDQGQTTVPAGLGEVMAIAAGWDNTMALKSDGTVTAWGKNDQGQTTIPAGLSGVTAIAAGLQYAMALKGDGTVVAWGSNGFGQTTMPPGLSGVTAIAAGGYHSLAIIGD